ncbi:YceH family protein [Marinobacterium aestuariivivens]|uniref:YceH family protein n=1 Tax=Marinobacterium aestuariivivens TaxID=1698799 RepID=A0ABW2A2P8_9GAMM
MELNLTLYQARVIGALIEKEITTPDQYPLSLNALTLACNQKSNRDPVLELDETSVQQTLDELARLRLVKEESGFGSRVVKYKHRFCNTEFGELQFSEQELGIICVLLLRGPQTPGELRTRTNRLCSFNDVQQVERVLQKLMERDNGPFVVRLAREPGKRESRYAHLFSGEVTEAVATGPVASAAAEPADDRLTELEQEVASLKAEVAELRELLEDLTS